MNRGKNYYANVFDPNTGPIEYHRFTLEPLTKSSTHRAIMSYNAFRESRNPKRGAPYYIILNDETDFRITLYHEWRSHEICGNEIPYKPVYFHDTIWDFYSFIGYDYKRKRFDQELYDNARKHRNQQPQDARVCFADYSEK